MLIVGASFVTDGVTERKIKRGRDGRRCLLPGLGAEPQKAAGPRPPAAIQNRWGGRSAAALTDRKDEVGSLFDGLHGDEVPCAGFGVDGLDVGGIADGVAGLVKGDLAGNAGQLGSAASNAFESGLPAAFSASSAVK